MKYSGHQADRAGKSFSRAGNIPSSPALGQVSKKIGVQPWDHRIKFDAIIYIYMVQWWASNNNPSVIKQPQRRQVIKYEQVGLEATLEAVKGLTD